MKTTLALILALSASTAIASSHGHGNPGAHFIENWDSNADGAVTLEEATERRSDVFASFDADDNGILNAEEYDLFDEARANDMKEMGMAQGNGQGKGKGQGNPAHGMKREFTDADGNGEVTLDEFMASVPAWYAKMDKNGDGTVTADDFGRK